MSSLAGRRIVVVGGTGGIGSAVVRTLLDEGASVLATGRDVGRLRELESLGARSERLELAETHAASRLRSLVGDVLDGLVVTAAELGPIGPTRGVDPDAVERSLREQPIAALRLIQSCASAIDASASPSIILFSGGGATNAFPNYTAYALAKVAIVRLVENLAVEEPNWKVNAVAPGFIATRIHEATLEAGRAVAGPYYDQTRAQLADPVSPTAAAELVAFLLSDESVGISGRLISAVWDDWRSDECQRLLREDPAFARLRRVDRR